jgi:hypothetical protein
VEFIEAWLILVFFFVVIIVAACVARRVVFVLDVRADGLRKGLRVG